MWMLGMANYDSFVFNVSDLKVHLQNNIQNNTWILGDAGYPLHKFLMTPYRLAEASSPQARYNSKAWNIVERTIGVLKSRFRWLLSVRGVHYTPEKATQIVNACCVLHNICQHFQVESPEEISSTSHTTMTNDILDIEREEEDMARIIRNNIMTSL
ncbi:putative nuclease HARBI1 [Bactrocera neohumeralis]|uniref:putative nuclease HARBI1 n=1 Tax=Bactrocera neohumeralis TaxID=98809 RepID=UPI00216657F8|nr:putative nuclease HARBI1 [Bactrocera neohumeralis]